MIHPTAQIHPTAVVYDNVRIDENVVIGPFCIIGAQAETKKTDANKGVHIMAGAILHGHNTVDSGTDGLTVIGSDCYLMKHVHIGHDATIGDEVTLAPHACIGGHVTVGSFASFGMHSVVHPQCIVAEGAMIGAGCVVSRGQSVQPWRKVVGVPSRDIGYNVVGMSRNGVTDTTIGVYKVKWNLG